MRRAKLMFSFTGPAPRCDVSRSSAVGITRVVIGNKLVCVDIRCGNPLKLFVSALIAHPADTVAQLNSMSFVVFRIENFCDFVMFVVRVIVEFDRARRGLSAVRNIVGKVRLELGNVKNRVNAAKVFTEAECI